ncbi:MAG: DUF295 domain-containing protein [Ktedonobacteraceae bacterium]|nr:DUF295 domain-containing protein [Ktedonobacteraceae bacterium]
MQRQDDPHGDRALLRLLFGSPCPPTVPANDYAGMRGDHVLDLGRVDVFAA